MRLLRLLAMMLAARCHAARFSYMLMRRHTPLDVAC